MKKKYILGVDGGNTKTHYALFDSDANLINFIEAGTASHERFANGYEGMEAELKKQITRLVEEKGLTIEDIGYSVLGLAGADVKKQYTEIKKRLSEIGLTNFKVFNDAYLGVKAACIKGYGINSVNGTGTTCAGIDKTGRCLQIGGCGELTGDDAGGGYILQAVIRCVYESMFRCGQKTMMKEMVFELLNITDEETYLDAVYDQVLGGTIRHDALPKIAFKAASQCDEVALRLLEDAGKETAKSVIGAYRRLNFLNEDEITVVMSGSIYVKGENQILNDAFKREVTDSMDCKVTFHLLKEPPVAGAVIWALQEYYGSLDEKTYKKVLNSFTYYK